MAISVSAYSQLGVTGYVENAVGVNYAFASRFNVDFKLITSNFNDIPVALSINYKLIKSDKYNIYAGAGFIANTEDADNLKAFIIPIGCEITPFENAKNLAFVIEALPTFNDNFILNKFFGIRYYFGN